MERGEVKKCQNLRLLVYRFEQTRTMLKEWADARGAHS